MRQPLWLVDPKYIQTTHFEFGQYKTCFIAKVDIGVVAIARLTLFSDFLQDITTIFPEDKNIKVAKTSIESVRKLNPALVIKTWNKYVAEKYGEVIQQGNLQYFVEKDYSEDVQKMANAGDIVKTIDMLREPIKNMNQHHLTSFVFESQCKQVYNCSEL